MYTLLADLSKWKITSGTLLYTFLRQTHQPSVKELPNIMTWFPLAKSAASAAENPSHEG